MLKSQQVRSLSPEMDPLRMGMGWTVDDLSKPQIMVESTYGNSHPGSGHLNIFVEEAVRGVNDHGGKAARYFATDMCDGMAQGHDGINYSLAHREAITNLVEAQANATTFDGGASSNNCTDSGAYPSKSFILVLIRSSIALEISAVCVSLFALIRRTSSDEILNSDE